MELWLICKLLFCFCGRHYWSPWLRQSWMMQRTLRRRTCQRWTLLSGSGARCSSPPSRSLSRCEGGPWAWLWPRPRPSPCLWQPRASRRWCLWWPPSTCPPGEGSIRWRPTSTCRGSPPYGLNPRWGHSHTNSVKCRMTLLSSIRFLWLIIWDPAFFFALRDL